MGEIPSEHVAKIDQELATARNNLRLHLDDMRFFRTLGDAPEKVFMGFSQEIYRAHKANPAHLAMMLAVAVLTLAEKEEARSDE